MNRSITTCVLVLGLLALAPGCVEQESRRAASERIGKDRVELAKVTGPPRQAVPMTDTGGEMLFYSYQGHHYIFETDPQGVVHFGVRTD